MTTKDIYLFKDYYILNKKGFRGQFYTKGCLICYSHENLFLKPIKNTCKELSEIFLKNTFQENFL